MVGHVLSKRMYIIYQPSGMDLVFVIFLVWHFQIYTKMSHFV